MGEDSDTDGGDTSANNGTIDTIASTGTPASEVTKTGEAPFDNSFYTNCTKENYDKLREEVQDDSFTDTAYLRFLTALNQDVGKACASMKKNSEWKKEKKVYPM